MSGIHLVVENTRYEDVEARARAVVAGIQLETGPRVLARRAQGVGETRRPAVPLQEGGASPPPRSTLAGAALALLATAWPYTLGAAATLFGMALAYVFGGFR